MQHSAFDMACSYCNKRVHCPEGREGRLLRCESCGSALMADPARTAEEKEPKQAWTGADAQHEESENMDL